MCQAVDAFCAEHGVATEHVLRLDVALDEVLANVILYAFGDGRPHEIAIEVALNETALSLEVADDGKPFDPLSRHAPTLDGTLEERAVGGLGIHLVRRLMDEVTYRRADGMNRLLLRKTIAAPKPNSLEEAPQ